jgi:hypothetical protein
MSSLIILQSKSMISDHIILQIYSVVSLSIPFSELDHGAIRLLDYYLLPVVMRNLFSGSV